MSQQRRAFLHLFGGLCLIWLLLNLPLLLGLRVLPWDAMISSYPTVYFNAHSLRMGELPWWNPHIYAGYPQIADPQGMLFSPLLMAWMLLRQSAGATWFAWGVLLHGLLGGASMLALLKRSGANAFGAWIGATVFMAGGVAASRLEHVPILLAYAYAPLVLLALRRFLQTPGWQRGLLLGLAAGAMVTQLVQLTYLFILMFTGYAAIGSALHWNTYRAADRRRWCSGMLLALACVLAMGLPQLLFTWAFTVLSNRAALPLAATAGASLDWRTFLTLLDPNALHALRGKYSGPADHVEAYLYIGAVPLLMLAGVPGAWKLPQQRRQIVFFAAAGLLACLYMLGLNAPLYGWLYGWLPGMPHFRRPSDAAYLLNFSLALVTGLAAGHFRLESRRHVCLLLVVATAWLTLASLPMHRTDVRWEGHSLAAAVFAMLALWRLRRPGIKEGHVIVWLLLLLVVDYRCFNLDGTFNEGGDRAKLFLHDTSADFLQQQLKTQHGTLPPRMEPLDAGFEWDNLVVLRHLSSTQGYNPLRYALYDRWYGARDNGAGFNDAPVRVETPFNPAADSKLTDLLSVRYVISGAANHSAPWLPPTGYTRVAGDAARHIDIWQNNLAYPRLLNPVHAIALTPRQMPDAPAFEATDFFDTLWLTPRDASDQLAEKALAATCTARLTITDARSTPTQITVDIRSSAPGWLVLGDLDFPGWLADADGARLTIHRANGMFRAVCIPAGQHTVRFVFHPWAMVADVWRKTHADGGGLLLKVGRPDPP